MCEAIKFPATGRLIGSAPVRGTRATCAEPHNLDALCLAINDWLHRVGRWSIPVEIIGEAVNMSDRPAGALGRPDAVDARVGGSTGCCAYGMKLLLAPGRYCLADPAGACT
jgi:hypothetical protein